MKNFASRLSGDASTTATTFARPATLTDAPLVHALYLATPDYFRIISIPTPTEEEVRLELEAAHNDTRRHVELILTDTEAGIIDERTGENVVGYLDYKLDYPDPRDVTVNLLLISSTSQNRGFGRACVQDLEGRLRGQAGRMLASIYGQNPRAERFWRSLGYHFAIDAKPVLDWYAKEL